MTIHSKTARQIPWDHTVSCRKYSQDCHGMSVHFTKLNRKNELNCSEQSLKCSQLGNTLSNEFVIVTDMQLVSIYTCNYTQANINIQRCTCGNAQSYTTSYNVALVMQLSKCRWIWKQNTENIFFWSSGLNKWVFQWDSESPISIRDVDSLNITLSQVDSSLKKCKKIIIMHELIMWMIIYNIIIF